MFKTDFRWAVAANQEDSPTFKYNYLQKLCLLLAGLLLLTTTAWNTQAGTGGGFTRSGVKGEYFANTTLSGSPSFTRYDVRIDFNWGNAAPGGSNSSSFKQISTDAFSVRWTGQLVAKRSESYTFTTVSDDGIRLFIKPANSSSWTTVIDNWIPHLPTENSAQFQLTAGQRYDLRLEYFENNGGAVAKLFWQSASTPREVIEPVRQVITHAAEFNDSSGYAPYADVFTANRGNSGDWGLSTSTGTPGYDANGWPTGDFNYIWWDGNFARIPNPSGTYRLSFKGQADVTLGLVAGYVDNATKVYDAASNTTSVNIVITQTTSASPYAIFRNTRRTANSAVNTGLSEVKLMRPVAPGSNASYATADYYTDVYRDLVSYFATVRFSLNNGNGTGTPGSWADRASLTRTTANASPSGAHSGIAWERSVQLANETGKDLYISVPLKADEGYTRNLARLVRYGSDGVNPYTSVQSNPVYAGLNPNLKVYVEYGNEVWNSYGDYGAQWNVEQATAEVNANPASPLNYDGAVRRADGSSDVYLGAKRRVANQTKKISDIFRQVFGDAAMPGTSSDPRVRPLFMWQYDNLNLTGSDGLRFLDNYYNNSDGAAHVSNPRPVNYFLWGGGGATYYVAGNNDATSVDDIYASGVPSPGYENSLKGQALWAKTYGLQYVAYEGGWAVQPTTGDVVGTNETVLAARRDGRAEQAHLNAQASFDRAGGYLNSVLSSVGVDQYPWTMSNTVYNLDTPLWRAHKRLIDELPIQPLDQVTDGARRLRNKLRGTYIYAENNLARAGAIQTGLSNTQWQLEPFGERAPAYYRIKNRATGGYLNVETGSLAVGAIGEGSSSSHWILEEIEPGYVRIKNRWTNGYLHTESGTLVCQPIQAGADSAKWAIERTEDLNSNLLSNSSFENGLSEWNTWSPSGAHNAAAYTETFGGAQTGSLHGTHFKGDSAYEVATYQIKSNLASGAYTMKAWVRSGGGQTWAGMYAKNYGGEQRWINIPITQTWTQITLENIFVTNGQCEFGFYSKAAAGKWLYFDDVEFVKTSNTIANTGLARRRWEQLRAKKQSPVIGN